MPSYHALRNRALAIVDRQFAERVRHSPMKQGVADPDRQQRLVTGVLRGGDRQLANLQGGYAQSWETRAGATQQALHIDPVRHPGLSVRVGDVMRAIDRPGEPVFEVQSVDDRQHTRIIVALGEA